MKDGLKNAARFLGEGKNRIYLAILAAALGVLVITSAAGEKATAGSPAARAAPDDGGRYAEEIENRLTALLTRIEGVGDAEVMVTTLGGGELVYAAEERSDSSRSSSERPEAQSVTVQRSESLQRSLTLLGGSGSGQEPVLVKVISPQISGVTVVCDGGGSAQVQLRVTQAVSALLSVPASRICVLPMSGGR